MTAKRTLVSVGPGNLRDTGVLDQASLYTVSAIEHFIACIITNDKRSYNSPSASIS